ncbi:MAG: hypothetical protein QOG75_3203, partial [Mycobacterium sp.]|nr:hypothetical protein [Mycobacterium sp.]
MPTVDPYGVATMPQPQALPKSPAERANHEAAQLLTHFNAAKMTPDGFVPHVGMPGGADIPKPHGLYTNSLIGPDVWPTESESAIKQASQDCTAFQQRHQQAADTTLTLRDQVFSTSWTSGNAADAAYEHYGSQYRAQLHVVDIAEAGAGAFDRLADDVGRTKRLMREAHDNAHKEIEAYLKAPGGAPTATIAGILATHRGLIQGYSTELRGRGAAETTLLTNKFGIPEAPQVKGAGNGPGNDLPTDHPREGDPTDLPPKKAVPTGGHTDDLPTSARPDSAGEPVATGGGVIGNALPTPAGVPPKGSGMPSMPSLPSPGGGGGGSSPLSSLGGGMGPLQGLMGGGKGLTGPLNNISPAALQGGPASGATSPASLGSQFGRGMAAGAGAAGAMPPISAPPQAPSAPLAAPISPAGGAPVSGAPAGGATYAPAGNAGGTGTPAVASGGAPAGPMSSYGSVLPPSGMPAPAGGGGGPASIGGAPAAPPVTGGAGTPASGFMPVRDQVAPQQVARHVSMTDLELARAAVADLAAASSVVYPGLEWAVVVSRSASGVPELWVTTNEGAGYIPAGVHIRRSMPLAARFDEDFDARWFGWFNPAETALRAVRARGDAVSAIATTWAQQSELVNDATPDVAIAVAPSSAPGDAEASQLLNSRSHRLETVAPGIYQSLDRAEQHVAEGYARQLTQEAAFSGPELSSVAQSVARGLISARWPSNEEWSALRTEYEMERLMAGSQRPGLQGYEQPEQLVGYVQDFVHCRRLETLLCWEHG